MTSKHVIRESESPRPAASIILISQMTRSLVIIPYLERPHTTRFPSYDESFWMQYVTTGRRRRSWHVGTLAMHHLTYSRQNRRGSHTTRRPVGDGVMGGQRKSSQAKNRVVWETGLKLHMLELSVKPSNIQNHFYN